MWTYAQLKNAQADWQQPDWTSATAMLVDTAEPHLTGVSIDTRTLQAGDVFFALRGAHSDGHAYLNQAVAQGAVALVVESDSDALDWASITRVPVLCVKDTRAALRQFAHWHRLQMPLKALIGVTGSNGKTTTKAMLAHCLQRQFQVLATEGNLNNELGVPLTLLQIRPTHDYAVIEMGANHAHEIGQLCEIAQPDRGIVTLAADAHLEGFGSLQTIIETKGELLAALPSDGYGVINLNSPGLTYWQTLCAHHHVPCIVFGEGRQADIQVLAVTESIEGLRFDVCYFVEGHPRVSTVALPMLGKHNAWNAVAAMAVCLQEGMDWDTLAKAMQAFKGVEQRLTTYPLQSGCLINDAYNANPSSMRSAIESLSALKKAWPGSAKTVACLGAMGELGTETQAAHQALAQALLLYEVDQVYLYGQATQGMAESLGARAQWFEHHAALWQAMQTDRAQQPDQAWLILVKGSRAMHMETIAQAVIRDWSEPTPAS